MEPSWKLTLIYVVMRVFLGTLLFFQAYDRVFRIGLENVVSEINSGRLNRINLGLLRSATFANTAFEFVFGFMVIGGVYTEISLVLISLHLLLVTVIFSFLKGVWNTSHVALRLGVCLILLALDSSHNSWSLDAILNL